MSKFNHIGSYIKVKILALSMVRKILSKVNTTIFLDIILVLYMVSLSSCKYAFLSLKE